MNNLFRGLDRAADTRGAILKAYQPVPRTPFRAGQPYYTPWRSDQAVLRGYSSSSWAYSCIRRLVAEGKRAPFGVQTRADGQWSAFDWSDWRSELLAYWNDDYGPGESVERAMQYLLCGGNAYLLLVQPRLRSAQPVTQIMVESPVGVLYYLDETGAISYYEAMDSEGRLRRWEALEVAHARQSDPSNQYLGIGTLQALARQTDLARANEDIALARAQSGGAPDGILYDQSLATDAKSRQAAQMDLDEAWSRVKGPFLIGGSAIQWIPMGMPSKDLQLLEGMEFSARALTVGFGLHPALLGHESTYNNLEHAIRVTWSAGVMPVLDAIADALTRRLIPRTERGKKRIYYDVSGIPALLGDIDIKSNAFSRFVGAGMPYDHAVGLLDLPVDKLPNGLGEVPMLAGVWSPLSASQSAPYEADKL